MSTDNDYIHDIYNTYISPQDQYIIPQPINPTSFSSTYSTSNITLDDNTTHVFPDYYMLPPPPILSQDKARLTEPATKTHIIEELRKGI